MKEAYIEADSIKKNFYFLFSFMDYDEMPIVFVVRDQEDTIYLCDCTEFRDCQKWIIAKTNIQDILDLANQRLSVYDALKRTKEEKIIVTYDYESDSFAANLKSFNELMESELPEKGAMLRYVTNDVRDKVNMLIVNERSKVQQEIEASVTESKTPNIHIYSVLCLMNKKIEEITESSSIVHNHKSVENESSTVGNADASWYIAA